MMTSLRNSLAALVLLAVSISGACAQGYAKVETPWFQQGKISGGISVTSSSSPTTLPAAGLIAWVCNTGAVDAYIAVGPTNSVSATVNGSSWLKAGTCGSYDLNPFNSANRFIAAITASSTTTLTVETGIGNPPAQGGGGGGGAVTGNVGGYEFAVAVTPTVQNAAYVVGNALGGTQTVSVFRTAGGTAKLNNVSMWSKSGSLINVTLYIFNATPSASTCTDKSAFVLGAADIAKLIAVTPPVLTPHIVGSGATATADSWQSPVSIVNGDSTTNVYVCPVIGGSVTPSTTSDYVFKFAGPQD